MHRIREPTVREPSRNCREASLRSSLALNSNSLSRFWSAASCLVSLLVPCAERASIVCRRGSAFRSTSRDF